MENNSLPSAVKNYPEIVRVEASAGAGKTRHLALRYIALLLASDPPVRLREILAVTFTNKAAQEMKERILLYLKQCALDDPECPPELYEITAGMPREKVRETARRRVGEILDQYHDFRVTTIDAFITSIARATALELALNPGFEVKLDMDPSIRGAVDEVLETLSPAMPKAMRSLEQMFETLQRLKGDLSWDLAEEHFKRVKRLIQAENNKGMPADSEGSLEAMLKLENKLRDVLKERILPAIEAGTLKVNRGEEPIVHFVTGASDVDGTPHVFRPAEKVFSKATVGGATGWDQVNALARKVLAQRAHLLLSPGLPFLHQAEVNLEKHRREGGYLYLAGLYEIIRDFIRDIGGVPLVYLKLGERLKHYLVDEFQDTSPMQWNVLEVLIGETLAQGGTFFYVGDKKQAIYGFRGGDYSIFDRASDFASVPAPRRERLDANYRCRAEIIKFVERAYAPESLQAFISVNKLDDAEADADEILEHFARVDQPPRHDGGFVRVEVCPAEEAPKEEADGAIMERLVALLHDDLLKRFKHEEVALLVRKNSEAADLVRALIQNDIPAVSPTALGLLASPRVKELLGFLKFLDSPPDDMAFAEWILSPVFLAASGLPAGADDVRAFLLDTARLGRPRYTAFRSRYPEIWEKCLAPFFEQVGFLPPYDLVSRILSSYDACGRFPGDTAFFTCFLELLKNLEDDGENSLQLLLKTVKAAQEDETEDTLGAVRLPEYLSAVRVITTHKAKGLQYPVVVLPFAYLNDRRDSDYFLEADGKLLPYHLTKKNLENYPAELRDLYRRESTRRVIEELNGFYVALTRAQDELHVLLPNYQSRSWSQKLQSPIPYGDAEYGTRMEKMVGEGEKKRPTVETMTVAPASGGHAWSKRLVRRRHDADLLTDGKRMEKIREGIALHKALQTVEPKIDIPDIFRPFWDVPPGAEVFIEKDIADERGEMHRVDRLILTADEARVADIKTGAGDPVKDRAQMKQYMELLRGIYPDKKVKGYLLYWDALKVEAMG